MPDKPGFLGSFSPWGSRSATPKPDADEKQAADIQSAHLIRKSENDHSVPNRPRIHPKDYPLDAPKSSIRWFHAVDVRSPLSTLGSTG